MKWRTQIKGDKRERVVFAWFPIDAKDGMTYWLERVRLKESFEINPWAEPFWLIRSVEAV